MGFTGGAAGSWVGVGMEVSTEGAGADGAGAGGRTRCIVYSEF